ncbi:MAG: leucine-rich repeat domain-containing protein [Duncaniella sp.]|nr:leucine-rich repeat domain-containing protein [Duncaniella sp.]
MPLHPKDGDIEYTLISIGEGSFSDNVNLYNIFFPEGLQEIGPRAFYGCKILEFDELPSTLRTIGERAFSGCASQTSIVLPEQLDSLGEGAFEKMSSLKKAVLFCDVDSVPQGLFSYCSALSQVYLPKGAKKICNYAFNYTAVDEIILPQELEAIGQSAFRHSKLTKISFSPSLREIGSSAFSSCHIKHLDFNEGLEIIGDSAFAANRLVTISFPSTLIEIGENAFFKGIDDIVGKVEIPSSLKIIGENAFYAVGQNIGEMTVGDGITDLPRNSLGIPAILTLGANVKTIDRNAFSFKDLRVLYLKSKTPPTVSDAFGLSQTTIDKITVIVPDGAKTRYSNNVRWKIFNILEESESYIQVHVTGDYPVTEEIRVQSGVMPSMVSKMKVTGKLSDSDWRLIRENMVSLISLDLSGISNTVIPADALMGMSLLTELILPVNTTEIGDNAFNGCVLLNMPSIPESVTKIGEYAFSGCKLLSITKLPDALETMGYEAFSGCTSLRSIIAGENLIYLESGTSGMPGNMLFSGCSALEYVDFSKTKVTKIGSCTFEGCTSLTTVALPDCLTEIQTSAFMNSSLETIDIPASVTTIGEQAFAGTKLRVVNIPAGVTEIPASTFASCTRLVNVNFPASLKSIGTDVMKGSTKVAGISCAAINAPEAATGAFNTLSARRCSLTVPTVSFRSYLNAPQWGIFANLLNRMTVEMPEKGVDVSYIDEQEYQAIQEEEKLREEAESGAETETPESPFNPVDPAGGDDNNGGETGNEPVKMAEKIAMSKLTAVRTETRAMMQDGSCYARLFDGATLGSPNTEMGTRVFINVQDGNELVAVYLDNKDVTDELEGNSLLLPSRANGSLRITARNLGGGNGDDDDKSLIETIGGDDCEAEAEYYTLQGVRVANPGHGIYIKRHGSKVSKVVL